MKLPIQAAAVVRASVSWPTRQSARGSAVSAIEPAAGGVVKCTTPTPIPCICDNGMVACCVNDAGCSIDPNTGNCACLGWSR